MAADCRQQESGGSSLLALGLTAVAAALTCFTSEAGFAGSESDFNKNPSNTLL